MRRSALSLVITLLLVPVFSHARSLERRLGEASQLVGIASESAFDALAENIADATARAVPVISSSAGFTYRYNAATEVFERTSQTLGPLYLERPDTLGRNKFNVSVSFQYVELNEFDGTALTDLENPRPIVIDTFDASGNAIGRRATRLRYSLGLQNYVTGLSFTWGVLDELDLNFYLPIIVTNMRVGVHAQDVATADLTGPFTPSVGPERVGRDEATAAGVGDILLRAKYQLPRLDFLRWALGMQLRLPSGSTSNFHGVGDVEISPFLYMSTILWDRVEPHVNLGVDFNTGDVARSAARYGAGIDVDVHPRVSLNIAYLGRSQFEDSADLEDTSFDHVGAPFGTPGSELLGLQFDRKDTHDLSFGMRAVVWRNIMVFVNGIYALNDDGLRNDTIIPAGGIEGTF